MPKKPISIRLENYRQVNELRIQNIWGRAQQLYLQNHGNCFWHLKADLIIPKENPEVVKN